MISGLLKSIGKKTLVLALIFAAIFFFRLNYVEVWFLLVGYQAASMAWNKRFSMVELGKGAILTALFLIILWYLGRFGKWGYVISIALTCLYILLSRRKEYLSVKYQIETMLWGKPLKDFKRGKDIPKIAISGFRPHKSTKKSQPK